MKTAVIILLVLSLGVLISCSEEYVPIDQKCLADADCVALECCHAKNAVHKDFAPECGQTLCTMNCEPDTLDCNQGEIRCIGSRCSVVINN